MQFGLSLFFLCVNLYVTHKEAGMKIQKAAEDYLEAMLMLKEKNGYIRSIDIANQLGVTRTV